jgi:hypothetical protein
MPCGVMSTSASRSANSAASSHSQGASEVLGRRLDFSLSVERDVLLPS